MIVLLVLAGVIFLIAVALVYRIVATSIELLGSVDDEQTPPSELEHRLSIYGPEAKRRVS